MPKFLCCSTLRNDRYYDRLTDISSRCYEWSSFTNQWFLRKKPLVSPSETDGSPMRTFHHAEHSFCHAEHSFCHAARTVICQSIIVSVSLHLSYLQRFMFKIDRLTVFSRNQFFGNHRYQRKWQTGWILYGRFRGCCWWFHHLDPSWHRSFRLSSWQVFCIRLLYGATEEPLSQEFL